MAKTKKAVEAAPVLSIGESDPRDIIIEGEAGEYHNADGARHTQESIEATAKSMLRYGQLQRVRVVDAGARGLVLVMGEGRVRAARWLRESGLAPDFVIRWEKIDLDAGDAPLATLVENTLRVAPNPLTVAKTLKAALDKGTSREECAVVAGGERNLDAYLDILARAAPPVQDALAAGKLSASAAKRLAEQPADVQEKVVEKVLDLAAQAERAEDGKVVVPDVSRKAAAEVDADTGTARVSNNMVEHLLREERDLPPPPKDKSKGKGKGKAKAKAEKPAPVAPPAPKIDATSRSVDALRRATGVVLGKGASAEEQAALRFAVAILDWTAHGTPCPKGLRAKYGLLFARVTGEGATDAPAADTAPVSE